MKTKVENLEGFSKKLTVELDVAEVDDRINKQYKDFAHRYNFPGFRKGKAPRPVVDNVLGPQAVVGTVTDEIFNKLYPLAMDEEGLVAISQPQFEDTATLVEPGKPFSFAVTVDTRPEYELSGYEPIAIKLPSTEATEDEIEAQIDELRNYYYDFEDANANTKVAEKGFAEIALNAKNEAGEAIDSIRTDSRLYELGMGMFPEEFDNALIGMKKGEKKTISVDMNQPSYMGQSLGSVGTVEFEVEIKQVKKRIVPDLTDEWVKQNAGFESIKELRERMAEQIKAQKQSLMPRLRENEALRELQKRLQGEVPEVMLEAQEQDLLQSFFYQMQQSGMGFDMFLAQNGLNPDTFKDDIKKQAADVCKQDLALDAWARHEKIEVTDADITAEFTKSGAEDPAALEAQWRSNGRMSTLRQGIARTKAIEAILDNLDITELAPGEKLIHEEDEATKETADTETAGKKDAPAKKDASAKGANAKDEGSAKKPAAKKTAAKKAAPKKSAAKTEDAQKDENKKEK